MNRIDAGQEESQKPDRRMILELPFFRYQTALVSALAALVLILTLLFYKVYYEQRVGLPQPISFSHRVHAHDKQISCIFCHDGVVSHSKAAVPPVQTCMLCHLKIITQHPEIKKLASYHDGQKPILWNRVNNLQDFSFFSHSAHIQRAIDCGRCHGNVARMDRVVAANEFTMGFCITCHSSHGASRDCLICHR
jgi:hypothetical protein